MILIRSGHRSDRLYLSTWDLVKLFFMRTLSKPGLEVRHENLYSPLKHHHDE